MKSICSIILILTVPGVTFAQNTQVRITNVNPKAATVYESYLRGWADLYRSVGEYFYLTALGAKEAQDARQHAIYNSVTAIRADQEIRQINREVRREQQPKYYTQDVIDFERKLQPARLTHEQLDSDGHIAWPDLLLANDYRQPRQALDELFRQRASTVPVGQKAEVHKSILDATSRLNAELVKRIENYPPTDYLAARKFIDSLRNEARSENAKFLTRL